MWKWILGIVSTGGRREALEADLWLWLERSEFEARRAERTAPARR